MILLSRQSRFLVLLAAPRTGFENNFRAAFVPATSDSRYCFSDGLMVAGLNQRE